MVKSLAAPYAAGRRGSAWLKVKTARTLDLVVLAVEWGSGRRKGWLSNIHLGARDRIASILHDLSHRPRKWLHEDVRTMTENVLRDWQKWQTVRTADEQAND